MIEVEKNVPIPAGADGKAGAPRKYPFGTMEVGDSFIVASGKVNLHSCATKAGIKITQRKQEDGTYRIWRVK